MADFTIVGVEALAEKAGTVALAFGGVALGGRKGGVAATVVLADCEGTGKDVTLGLSKLDGEAEWIIDSMTIGSFPAFANGVGSRCTLLKAIRDEALIAALDEAAAGVTA